MPHCAIYHIINRRSNQHFCRLSSAPPVFKGKGVTFSSSKRFSQTPFQGFQLEDGNLRTDVSSWDQPPNLQGIILYKALFGRGWHPQPPRFLGTYCTYPGYSWCIQVLRWSSKQSLRTLPVSFKLFGVAKAHGLENAAASAREATAAAFERRESIGMERGTKVIPKDVASWAQKKLGLV